MTTQDRSHETIINDTLARFLRERCRLDAVAETLQHGKRPDIVVRRTEGPVILEIEVEPASTVEADALSRLGMEIDGRKIQNVFAIAVPKSLRSVSQQYLYDRIGVAKVDWQEWRSDGTSGPKLSGSPRELATAVERTASPAGNLDQAVDVLDEGARRAGALLYSSPGTIGRVAKIFRTAPGDEVANMAALVVINAMVFQERLASREAAFSPVSSARSLEGFSRHKLIQQWDHILSIDYKPIFHMARQVVGELTDVEGAWVLDACVGTAAALLSLGAVGRHDLAGRVFNRLISERKLLAAFYTSIPASTLLAGLALSPSKWKSLDWGNTEDVSKLRVVDPACGTGTLLMAAYRQVVHNHASAAGTTPGDALHQVLVERVIMGADVVQSGIHLTAATLAAMSPSVRFEQMQLHTLTLGKDESGSTRLGSLDWLVASEVQSTFSTTEEQIEATSGAHSEGRIVERPRADLVISNPPFTRRGSDGGNEASLSRIFSLPENDKESQEALGKLTSKLLKGSGANQMAGHASSFTVLADRMVKPGGRIALVLPVTALFGESWREIRQMLAAKYTIEVAVTSHDPKKLSMSYDTAIGECLLVARRLQEGDHPTGRGLFVNLWRAPYQETDALALTSAINAMVSSPVHRSDGPPVGGSPLTVGGDQWGEIVDGPVYEGPWTAARWRRALTAQFAGAIERGELWTGDGAQLAGNIPVALFEEVCDVGPQHRQIRGSLGVFDGHHGWNPEAQFPALWSLDSSVHKGMLVEPNAWLVPRPERDHQAVWAQAGMLQISPSVRYTSQPIMAARTDVTTLGVNTWFSLRVHEDDPLHRARREVALALWCNSTIGMLTQSNHANSVQQGRGIGNKGMLETLTTLDVRQLQPWQLDEADSIWRDFRHREFKSFHECAVDPVRVALDERLVRGMLGLSEDAVDAVARIRALLASDPSIHGSKGPALPA